MSVAGVGAGAGAGGVGVGLQSITPYAYKQPTTGYCLLKSDPGSTTTAASASAAAFTIMLTNVLPSATNIVLAFVEKQLQRNPHSSNSSQKSIGNVGSLPQRVLTEPSLSSPLPAYSPDSENHTLCYISFVSNSGTAWDYLILLIVEFDQDEHFDLFRGELDGFSRKVSGLLSDNLDKEKKERISSYLSKWYTLSVEYITRCVNTYGEKLDYILHAAVQGKPINPALFPSSSLGLSQDTDLTRFMEALNIVSMLQTSNKENTTSQNLLDLSSPTLNTPSQAPETNEFCKEWAAALRSAPKNPLTIRFHLEEKKCSIIQELNSIKRIMNQAKIDNYALYKAYRALKRTRNQDVMLSLLHCDESNDADLKEVVRALDAYILGRDDDL